MIQNEWELIWERCSIAPHSLVLPSASCIPASTFLDECYAHASVTQASATAQAARPSTNDANSWTACFGHLSVCRWLLLALYSSWSRNNGDIRTWWKYMKSGSAGSLWKALDFQIFSGKIVKIEIPSFNRALWIIQQRRSKQPSQFCHGAFWWGMAATIAVRVILPPLPPALWIGSPWGLLHGLRTCWGSALEL